MHSIRSFTEKPAVYAFKTAALKITAAALLIFTLVLMIVPVHADYGMYGCASQTEPRFSPAFDILEKNLSVVKSGKIKCALRFEPEDFETALDTKKSAA